MNTATYKKNFRANPSVNPETGRSIKVGGETYNQLLKKYGKASPKKSPKKSPTKRMSPRKSVTMTKMSPGRMSQIRMSPTRINSIRVENDPFEVLSEESILNVLRKLNESHRLVWIASSPKVKRVYELNF